MIYPYFMSLLFAVTNAGDILLLTPFSSHSHKNLFIPLAYGLAEKGHNVTLLSIHKPQQSSPFVNEVVMTELVSEYKQMVYWMCKEGIDGGTAEVHNGFSNTVTNMCEIFFQNEQVQKWVSRKERFDMVIIDGVTHDCLYPYGHLVGKKVGVLNTATLFPWIAHAVDSPYPYSLIPFPLFPFTNNMNFWQRMISAYESIMYDFGLETLYFPPIDKIVKTHFPQAMSIVKAMKQVSLVLCNQDYVFGGAKLSVPTIVNIGGIHCRQSQPLSKEFEEIVQSAEEGFIIFSLGSIFNESLISDEKKNHIFTAFSKLKYKILWKTKENLGPNVPSNVKIVKWIPQQDLLGHLKCIAFITHSGLLSLQEAVYHSVPIIAIPLFAEQPINAAYVEDLGIAVRLDWVTFTADDLLNAVKAVTTTEFKKKVEEYSRIFKDVPISSLNEAIFRIEYVMRNDVSDSILKIDTNELNFFQYYLLDVIGFLVLLIFFVFFSCYKYFKFIYKLMK